jgi:hypothetical protein
MSDPAHQHTAASPDIHPYVPASRSPTRPREDDDLEATAATVSPSRPAKLPRLSDASTIDEAIGDGTEDMDMDVDDEFGDGERTEADEDEHRELVPSIDQSR